MCGLQTILIWMQRIITRYMSSTSWIRIWIILIHTDSHWIWRKINLKQNEWCEKRTYLWMAYHDKSSSNWNNDKCSWPNEHLPCQEIKIITHENRYQLFNWNLINGSKTSRVFSLFHCKNEKNNVDDSKEWQTFYSTVNSFESYLPIQWLSRCGYLFTDLDIKCSIGLAKVDKVNLHWKKRREIIKK